MLSHAVAKTIENLAARGVSATVFSGKEYLAQDQGGNKITFVETEDTYGPPERVGAKQGEETQRSIYTRMAGASVFIWGISSATDPTPEQHRAVTNALIHQVILSLFKYCKTALVIKGGRWIAENPDFTYGALYELLIDVKIPVCDEAWTFVEGNGAIVSDVTTVLVTGAVLTNGQVVGGTENVSCLGT